MIRHKIFADISEELLSELSHNDDELAVEEVLALEAT